MEQVVMATPIPQQPCHSAPCNWAPTRGREIGIIAPGITMRIARSLASSHTHLSGTGCIDMLDVLLMPATDDFKFDPMAAPNSPASYRSRFSHDDEKAVPGYYQGADAGLEGQGGIDGHRTLRHP